MQFSIIIPTFNRSKILTETLASVLAQTFQDFEVILVDNGSTDNSILDIEKRWPGLQIIHLDQNLGFAVANNIAAKKAKGEWLALLGGIPEQSASNRHQLHRWAGRSRRRHTGSDA